MALSRDDSADEPERWDDGEPFGNLSELEGEDANLGDSESVDVTGASEYALDEDDDDDGDNLDEEDTREDCKALEAIRTFAASSGILFLVEVGE